MTQQQHSSHDLQQLIDKLYDVPTSLHVDYHDYGAYFLASWKEHGQNYSVFLGADIDGRIAKRIAKQEQREKAYQEQQALQQNRVQMEDWTPSTCSEHGASFTLVCEECRETIQLNGRLKKMYGEDVA
jgi:hypothetical protein